MMRQLVQGVLLAGLLLQAPAGDAFAQELEGLPVRQIEFSGLTTLTEDTLRFYLGLEVGKPYSARELNDAIRTLWQRSLIEDIRVEARAFDGGVGILVEVEERPVLSSIDYQGLKRISRADISDRIIKDRINVREGEPLSLGELRRLKAAIEGLYAEKGFRLAEATYVVEATSAAERRVTFTVDEGDKVRIGDIDFEGNTVFADRRLRWAMKKTKESGFITRLTKKDVFNVATFEEDLDKVRDIYRKVGYKNVVLGEPKIEVIAKKPGAPSAKQQKRRLSVTIPIEEGDRWKLGEITINGNERFSDEVLLRQFEEPRGGWLRSSVIDKGVEAVSELYSNTGYLYSRVDTEIEEREDQVADLIVEIEEGDQFRVGTIEFEGNTKTRDKVIRREMGIQEGFVLNAGALRNSLLRIRQLEFFKVDEEDPVTFDFDNENKIVDLVVKGEEGDRTELLFGGGFSEIDGFFGQFSFRTRNFLGRGETLGVSVQSGRRQDIYDLSYYIPFFLDRPQSVGVQAFRRSLNYNLLAGQTVIQETQGGTLTYGRNLGLFRSASLTYSFFDVEDIRRTFVGGELISQDFSRGVSTARVAYVFDRRDSRLQPTVGMRYALGLEYTGGFLGGSTNFVRPTASFTLYKPVTKGTIGTVAAFNVEAGYIEPFGGQELFFNDRFYLGGESSIRGHRFRSIWVRNDAGETQFDEFLFPLGGDYYLQFNLEYIFLLGGPFRALVFADAGNVFTRDQSPDFDRLRYTSGVELQINVPMFGAPLRFIYSFNLDPLPNDRFQTFQFSIGPSF